MTNTIQDSTVAVTVVTAATQGPAGPPGPQGTNAPYAVTSDVAEVPGGSVRRVVNMVSMSQSDYDAIDLPDADTFYIITS